MGLIWLRLQPFVVTSCNHYNRIHQWFLVISSNICQTKHKYLPFFKRLRRETVYTHSWWVGEMDTEVQAILNTHTILKSPGKIQNNICLPLCAAVRVLIWLLANSMRNLFFTLSHRWRLVFIIYLIMRIKYLRHIPILSSQEETSMSASLSHFIGPTGTGKVTR